MDTLKEMYRQSQPGAFDEELGKGFVNISKIECIAIGLENVTTEYFNKNLNDLKEDLNEMAKCNNAVLIGSNGGDVCKSFDILSKVLKENTGKGLTVIVVDENTKLKNIPDLTLEQVAKGYEEFEERLIELTIPKKIESVCYLPDFKKTRKEKKQEYHFNHRKNWRKRK